MKYKLVCEDDLTEFNSVITELLNEGWDLVGSHSITVIPGNGSPALPGGFKYSQSLIKE